MGEQSGVWVGAKQVGRVGVKVMVKPVVLQGGFGRKW